MIARALLALLAVVGASTARADQTDPRLELFFEELKTADEAEAARLSTRIVEVWSEASSPTAQLLFNRALEAEFAGETDLADELLTQTVGLYPSFAEAWAARGRIRLAAGDVERATRDFVETRRLEQRHYPTLVLIAQTRIAVNDEKGALVAFLEALALNPHLEQAKSAVRRLQRRVGGQEI